MFHKQVHVDLEKHSSFISEVSYPLKKVKQKAWFKTSFYKCDPWSLIKSVLTCYCECGLNDIWKLSEQLFKTLQLAAHFNIYALRPDNITLCDEIRKGSAGKTALMVGKQSLFFSQYLLCVGRLTGSGIPGPDRLAKLSSLCREVRWYLEWRMRLDCKFTAHLPTWSRDVFIMVPMDWNLPLQVTCAKFTSSERDEISILFLCSHMSNVWKLVSTLKIKLIVTLYLSLWKSSIQRTKILFNPKILFIIMACLHKGW